MFSYSSFWRTLKCSGITQEELMERGIIGPAALAAMRVGRPISLTVIGRLCWILECDIEDIVRYVPEDDAPIKLRLDRTSPFRPKPTLQSLLEERDQRFE